METKISVLGISKVGLSWVRKLSWLSYLDKQVLRMLGGHRADFEHGKPGLHDYIGYVIREGQHPAKNWPSTEEALVLGFCCSRTNWKEFRDENACTRRIAENTSQ